MIYLLPLTLILTGPTDEAIVVEQARVQLISEVRVPATESGKLIELGVEEGEFVKAGQQIGRIDDDLAQVDGKLAKIRQDVAIAESENTVEERSAQEALNYAEKELELSLAAVKRVEGSLPQTELDRLKKDMAQAKLAIEQAHHKVRVAKLNKQLRQQELIAAQKRIARRQIRAPFDGMVVEVFADLGEWLEPKDAVVRIVKLDRLRVEVHLDASQFGPELKGCPVKLSAIVPGKRREEFKGEITFVSPEVQPVTGKVRVWAEVSNREMLLRPGVHGTLNIYPNGKNLDSSQSK